MIFSCTSNKGVYWCGDHPCINKEEKEAYFKKTMIVEVKNYNKDKNKNDSEIERLMNQAKLDEKKRINNEKQMKIKTKNEEKDLAKRIKIEKKKRIKEEKELAKQLKIEEAIRKLTSLPAKTFRLKGRGVIHVGFAADLVVFDPKKIQDNATFKEPHAYATGFRLVIVNGQVVVEDDLHNGAGPGRIIRRAQ